MSANRDRPSDKVIAAQEHGNVQSAVHATAHVSPEASIGSGTRIWHYVQVRERACVGRNCIIGKGAYVGVGVVIGDNTKIQNACQVYQGVTLENGVFLGPGVILANDKYPRAINPDGSLKSGADWLAGRTLIREGASVGAGTVVLPGVTVGTFAIVGAGSVVTRDVPSYGVAWGNPARLRGFACPCGHRLQACSQLDGGDEVVRMSCSACGGGVEISVRAYRQLEATQ